MVGGKVLVVQFRNRDFLLGNENVIADSGQAEDLPGRELVKMFDLNFFAEVVFLTLFSRLTGSFP
ncbi:Protein of unknown function [Lactobacillus delbrueckii subsp. lactis]|jgi:hypothetical protein|nr:Protein of unknown function [Lactobacillus delbrueckii subsp. lactis]